MKTSDIGTNSAFGPISPKVHQEILELFIGLALVFQTMPKKVTDDPHFRASLYFQPLDSKYSWMDDAIRSSRCESCLLITAILKLLVSKADEIPDPNNYFLKNLDFETSKLLLERSHVELDHILGPVLAELAKFFEFKKATKAPDGIALRPIYRFRAEQIIGNKVRWYKGIARIIYRYHLGRTNRDVRDGFALIQVWG